MCPSREHGITPASLGELMSPESHWRPYSAQWLQLAGAWGAPRLVWADVLCACVHALSHAGTLFSCLSAVPWLQEKARAASCGLFLKAFSGGKCHLSTSAMVQVLFAKFRSS